MKLKLECTAGGGVSGAAAGGADLLLPPVLVAAVPGDRVQLGRHLGHRHRVHPAPGHHRCYIVIIIRVYLLYPQVTLHLCYAHAGVAPLVQLLLHPAPALTRLRSQVTTTDQIRYI